MPSLKHIFPKCWCHVIICWLNCRWWRLKHLDDRKSIKYDTPGQLGQSGAPFDWYSGDCGFDPRLFHMSFIEIWSRNNFYGHSLPIADSSRAIVSYWRKYGHLVMVNRLRGLLGNTVDRLTDRLHMALMCWLCRKTSNQTTYDTVCTLSFP